MGKQADDFDDFDLDALEDLDDTQLALLEISGNSGTWRQVEMMLEQRKLHENIMDFDDYYLD